MIHTSACPKPRIYGTSVSAYRLCFTDIGRFCPVNSYYQAALLTKKTAVPNRPQNQLVKPL